MTTEYLHTTITAATGTTSTYPIITEGMDFYRSSTTEVILEENSHLHLVLLYTHQNASLFENIFITQKAHSELTLTRVILGSGAVRIFENHVLNQHTIAHKNRFCYATDLAFVSEKYYTVHTGSDSTVVQNYGGVVKNTAQVYSTGRIYVQPGCPKTDSSLHFDHVLQDHAVVLTQPELEIYTDDVKCNHGAALSQLDDNALYYLQSRGIDQDAAHHMLHSAKAKLLLDFLPKDNPIYLQISQILEKYHIVIA